MSVDFSFIWTVCSLFETGEAPLNKSKILVCEISSFILLNEVVFAHIDDQNVNRQNNLKNQQPI